MELVKYRWWKEAWRGVAWRAPFAKWWLKQQNTSDFPLRYYIVYKDEPVTILETGRDYCGILRRYWIFTRDAYYILTLDYNKRLNKHGRKIIELIREGEEEALLQLLQCLNIYHYGF